MYVCMFVWNTNTSVFDDKQRKGAIMTSFKTLIKKLQSLGWFFLGHVKKCENYYLSGHLKIVEVQIYLLQYYQCKCILHKSNLYEKGKKCQETTGMFEGTKSWQLGEGRKLYTEDPSGKQTQLSKLQAQKKRTSQVSDSIHREAVPTLSEVDQSSEDIGIF